MREARCVNCGHWLLENPKSGEWLHRSTAERDCNTLLPRLKALPIQVSIRPLRALTEDTQQAECPCNHTFESCAICEDTQ